MQKLKSIFLSVKKKYARVRFLLQVYKENLLIRIRAFFYLNWLSILLLLIALLVAIPITPEINIPILNIKKNISILIPTIIQASASILGIVIAVILVIFELQRKYLSGFTFKYFFTNRIVRNLFTIFIYSSTVGIIALVTFSQSELSIFSIKYAYLSVLSFVFGILYLFPALNNIFSAQHIKEKAARLADNIQYGDEDYFNRRVILRSDSLRLIEDNPIFLLGELGVNTLKEGGSTACLYVIAEARDKLVNLIDSNAISNRRELIKAFLFIFKSISRQALKSKIINVLISITDTYQIIHIICAKNKSPYYELFELDEAIEEHLIGAVNEGLDQVVEDGIFAIEFIIKEHLNKNFPSQDEISEMSGGKKKLGDETNNHDGDLKYQYLTHGIYSMASSVIEASIAKKSLSALRHGPRLYISIALESLKYTFMTDKQKASLIGWNYYYATNLILKGIDKELWDSISASITVSQFDIDRFLEIKKYYSKQPLIDYGNFLIELAKRDKIDSGTLNDIGALGRGLTRKIHEDILYEESFSYILEVLEALRKIIKKNQSYDSKKLYITLYRQTLSFKNWLKEHQKNKKIRSALLKNVRSKLNKYSDRKKIEKELKKQDLKWPSNIKPATQVKNK